jgi:heat shock protein HslJ
MLFRRFLPLALVAALPLTGCEKEYASPTDAVLQDTRWLLVKIDDDPIALSSYSETSRSYLEFVGLSQGVVGLAPCNNFSSRFRLSSRPQELRITAPIATRATCPAQNWEDRYLANLPLTTRYEINGDELRLYDDQQPAPRLVFRRGEK